MLPNDAVQQEVTAFKQIALTRFASGHALKSPPHITLIPPFLQDQEDFSSLQDFASLLVPFTVRLNGFSRFDQRVIYVDVPIDESLIACQQALAAFCTGQFNIKTDARPFHPHMTVAFKDLKSAVFSEAWRYFSGLDYKRNFIANAITLLRHTGERWQIMTEFSMGRPTN